MEHLIVVASGRSVELAMSGAEQRKAPRQDIWALASAFQGTRHSTLGEEAGPLAWKPKLVLVPGGSAAFQARDVATT